MVAIVVIVINHQWEQGFTIDHQYTFVLKNDDKVKKKHLFQNMSFDTGYWDIGTIIQRPTGLH